MSGIKWFKSKVFEGQEYAFWKGSWYVISVEESEVWGTKYEVRRKADLGSFDDGQYMGRYDTRAEAKRAVRYAKFH